MWDSATIVAVVTMVCMFGVLAVAIMKGGVNAAGKLWNLIGPLVGATLGLITTHYFVTDSNRKAVQTAQAQRDATQLAYQATKREATQAKESLDRAVSLLRGTVTTKSASAPATAWDSLMRVPERDRAALVAEFKRTSDMLGNVAEVKVQPPAQHGREGPG